jgi:hypothetical protein
MSSYSVKYHGKFNLSDFNSSDPNEIRAFILNSHENLIDLKSSEETTIQFNGQSPFYSGLPGSYQLVPGFAVKPQLLFPNGICKPQAVIS